MHCEYKGYVATVTFDEAAGVFHGEVINLRDVITFQGTSPDNLEQAFAASVEDYLALCAVRGEIPPRPFSFADFEGCVAHFKAHPPQGGAVDLDFSDEEIRHVRDQSAKYDCTADVFLTAVMACFVSDLQRRRDAAQMG